MDKDTHIKLLKTNPLLAKLGIKVSEDTYEKEIIRAIKLAIFLQDLELSSSQQESLFSLTKVVISIRDQELKDRVLNCLYKKSFDGTLKHFMDDFIEFSAEISGKKKELPFTAFLLLHHIGLLRGC